MDNNGNFEQQFTQNLKASAPAPTAATVSASPNKVSLVIIIALAAITLLESIVLIITLSNYFSIMNEGSDDIEEVSLEEEPDANNYTYDNDYNLLAFGLTCVAEDGSSYEFTLDNKYEQYNGAGSLAASGPYTITNDSLISLSGSNKVLYYDGFDVADGTTIYTCEETAAATEADTNDTEAE